MNIKDHILFKIRTHFDNNHIWISDSDVNLIYNDVLKGVYAFKITYYTFDTFDTHIIRHSYKFENYSHLDYRLIKEFSKNYDLISIDGGIRYQWNKKEVLFIDPVEVRDLKLKEIGI